MARIGQPNTITAAYAVQSSSMRPLMACVIVCSTAKPVRA